MIFKSTEKLRDYLVKQRARKSLHAIQRDMFPNAKVGTLSRIINDSRYDPFHKEVRAALRLTVDVCHTCKRNMPKPRQAIQPAPKIGQPGWMDYWMRKIK